jgi:hypothetical protein
LFDLPVFLCLMLASALMVVKDYKQNFQYASNNHVRIGVMTFGSYAVMIVASVFTVQWFGTVGFLAAWLAAELAQIAFAHECNIEFLSGGGRISLQPAIRLAVGLAAAGVLVCSAESFLRSPRYLLQGVVALSAMAALAVVSYFLFDLRELGREGKGQLERAGLSWLAARMSG